MTKVTLEEIIRRVKDIPTLPNITNEIMRLTEDPDSTVRDIENVIMKDQSLTARILRLANSAYYGYPRRISTISEASVLLGFQAIRSITLTASVGGLLVREVPGYGLEKNELWKQSQSCAIISRYIARKVHFARVDQAYVAGLLRDIGKVIVSYYLTEYFKQIMNLVENENISFLDAEEEILGFHHGQVGAEIAKKWNLPEELAEAIAYHHNPEKATINPKLTSIVHIADAIVMTLGIGLGVDGMVYNFSGEAIKFLGIDEPMLDQIISDVSDLLLDEDAFTIT
ncbi:MAG TPA: HDOD domain-containing protein [Clostridia bacterium]|nr:HDOD domain-containing protein [Clostridia bacterium]